MQIEKKVFSKLFKGKTNLSKKVDLALGDNLESYIDDANKQLERLGSIIDERFTPIREIERIISNNYFGELDVTPFVDSLQQLEEEYNIEADKLIQAEIDLGINIARPKILEDALQKIVRLQNYEQVARDEVNEYYKELDKYNLR